MAPLTGGAAKVLVTGQISPTGVAVDSNHVYFANLDGTIDEASLKDGTGLSTLVTTGQTDPIGVAVVP